MFSKLNIALVCFLALATSKTFATDLQIESVPLSSTQMTSELKRVLEADQVTIHSVARSTAGAILRLNPGALLARAADAAGLMGTYIHGTIEFTIQKQSQETKFSCNIIVGTRDPEIEINTCTSTQVEARITLPAKITINK